jgi:hypothetical protein
MFDPLTSSAGVLLGLAAVADVVVAIIAVRSAIKLAVRVGLVGHYTVGVIG